jgi:hypothetical protein
VKTDEKIDNELILNSNYTNFNPSDAVAIDTRCYTISLTDKISKVNLTKYID